MSFAKSLHIWTHSKIREMAAIILECYKKFVAVTVLVTGGRFIAFEEGTADILVFLKNFLKIAQPRKSPLPSTHRRIGNTSSVPSRHAGGTSAAGISATVPKLPVHLASLTHHVTTLR